MEPPGQRAKRCKVFRGAQGQAVVAEVAGSGPPALLAHGGGQTRPLGPGLRRDSSCNWRRLPSTPTSPVLATW